jgi:hypothetical protein
MAQAHSPLENRTVVVTGAARGLGAATLAAPSSPTTPSAPRIRAAWPGT